MVRASGQNGPTFENKVPLEFWQEVEQAIGKRHDEKFKLKQTVERNDPAKTLVLTSEDGVLAHLAAPEAAELFHRVLVLEGGNAAWKGEWEAGVERATTTRDDVWYKPYDHSSDYLKHARDYLQWEVALADQIKRDPTIRFRTYS